MARIMVVDDRALNRKFLKTLLHYHDYEVLEATDGEEALAMVREQRPDLIVTDIAMPRMDGLEFVRQVQRDSVAASTPIIFYSATYRVPEARKLAQGCRAAAVLAKPSEPEVIMAAVRAALGEAPAPFEADKQAPGLNPSLVALMDFQQELAGIHEAGRVLQLACGAAPNLLGADFGALGFESPGTGELATVLTSGLQACAAFPTGSHVTEAFEARISNPQARRAWNPAGRPETLGLPAAHPPVRSLLVVPLVGMHLRHGWIYVANRSDGQPFGAADEELLALIARQAMLAYETGLYAEQAERDALTELYNRRAFDAALEREVARSVRQRAPLAVLFADLDHFKECNDRHGHAAGDEALRAVGAYFKQAVRGYDHVYRFGGEEFVILLPGSTTEDAVGRAEEIRSGIKALEMSHGSRAIGRITVSLGVAGFPEHGESGAALLRAADQALYAAKHEGRDRTCVAPARRE